MKNPLLAIIALVALAGILLAQGPPSSVSAHSVVRQVELVGPIQVEGIVPLRNHVSIPWTSSRDAAGAITPFEWTCPPGTHARITMISDGFSGAGTVVEDMWRASLQLASGETAHIFRGATYTNANYVDTAPDSHVLHPGDTLRLENIASSGFWPSSSTGILQLALEYD